MISLLGSPGRSTSASTCPSVVSGIETTAVSGEVATTLSSVVERRTSSWPPGFSGSSRTIAKSPPSPTLVEPTTSDPATISTVDFGAALPATTREPSGSTRTMSKDGASTWGSAGDWAGLASDSAGAAGVAGAAGAAASGSGTLPSGAVAVSPMRACLEAACGSASVATATFSPSAFAR